MSESVERNHGLLSRSLSSYQSYHVHELKTHPEFECLQQSGKKRQQKGKKKKKRKDFGM